MLSDVGSTRHEENSCPELVAVVVAIRDSYNNYYRNKVINDYEATSHVTSKDYRNGSDVFLVRLAHRFTRFVPLSRLHSERMHRPKSCIDTSLTSAMTIAFESEPQL